MNKRQTEIWQYIDTFRRMNGRAPKMHEIREFCGFLSVSSVSHHLDAMEKLGFIRRGREHGSLEALPHA